MLDVGCPLLFELLLPVELLLLLLFSGLGAEPAALPSSDRVALRCGCVECRLCNELDVGELLVGANGDGLLVEFAEPLDELLLPVRLERLETGEGASGDALLVGDSRE